MKGSKACFMHFKNLQPTHKSGIFLILHKKLEYRIAKYLIPRSQQNSEAEATQKRILNFKFLKNNCLFITPIE